MKYSKIIDLGYGSPVVGVVGLFHGDEQCGRVVLDELQSAVPLKGTLRLIYANLPAAEKDARQIEANLNRVFPGKKDGLLEERMAFELQAPLSECDLVIDIHAMYDPSPAFVISHLKDDPAYDLLASQTGVGHYAVTGELTKSGGLIDFVHSQGGRAISVETGLFRTEECLTNARNAVRNFLIANEALPGQAVISAPKKFVTDGIVIEKDPNFVSFGVPSFELLRAGIPYGAIDGRELSLSENTFPVISTKYTSALNGLVFLKSGRVN